MSVIDHVIIADPSNPNQSEWESDLVWRRLQAIFKPSRGFVFQNAEPDYVWFPTQYDPYSCGLRTYEIMRVLLERINEAYHVGAPGGFHPNIWHDLSVDCQPGK